MLGDAKLSDVGMEVKSGELDVVEKSSDHPRQCHFVTPDGNMFQGRILLADFKSCIRLTLEGKN